MPKEYSQTIKDAVAVLCNVLKDEYPEVFNQIYDSLGRPTKEDGSTFQERMEMCVYIELIKAGVKFEDENERKLRCSRLCRCKNPNR
jgi:hypothetical protein